MSSNYQYHLWNNKINCSMLPRFLNLLHEIGCIINGKYLFPKLNYLNLNADNFYLKILTTIKTLTLPKGTHLYHSTSFSNLIKSQAKSEITLPLNAYSYFTLSSDTSIAVLFHFFLNRVHELTKKGEFPDLKYINLAQGLLFTFELLEPITFNCVPLKVQNYIDKYCNLKIGNYIGFYYQLLPSDSYFFYDGMLELCLKDTNNLLLIRAQLFDFFKDFKDQSSITPSYYNNLIYEENIDYISFLEKYGRQINFDTYLVSEVALSNIYKI